MRKSQFIANFKSNYNGELSIAKLIASSIINISNIYCVVFDMNEKLTAKEYKDLIQFCNKLNLPITFNLHNIEELENYLSLDPEFIPFFRIADESNKDIALINACIDVGCDIMITDSGYTTEEFIRMTDNNLVDICNDVIIMHSNEYDIKESDRDLNIISYYKGLYEEDNNIYCGFSNYSNENGVISSVAKMLGATYFEYNLTYDKLLEGPDHSKCIEINQLKNIINEVNLLDKRLGKYRRV